MLPFGESPAFYPLLPPSTHDPGSTHRNPRIFLKILFKRARHLPPSGVLLSRGQDVAHLYTNSRESLTWHY